MEFTLAEVYARGTALARLHHGNVRVRDKIRQQLQRLRDPGLVEFLARGGNFGCCRGTPWRAPTESTPVGTRYHFRGGPGNRQFP